MDNIAEKDQSVNRESKKSTAELDEEYEKAVKDGDKETYESLLRQKAEETRAELLEYPDVTTYSVRRGAKPKKTIKVYKTFTVDNNGNPTALFVSSGVSIPVGIWLNAQDTYHFIDSSNGRMYVPSTKNKYTKGGATGKSIPISNISNEDIVKLEELGYLKRNSKGQLPKTITALAYRPGWHAGDLPFFPQGGMQIDGSNYENVHRYNQVVFECEMDADIDYTKSEVKSTGKNAGKLQYFDMQQMPVNGSYKFATNPMANAQDIGAWYISGALKIVRPLTEQECNDILADNGRPSQEWQAYQDGLTEEKTIGELDLNKLNVDVNRTDAYKKLFEPTYDDNGNLIPLSQRYDSSVSDPRYSKKASLSSIEELAADNEKMARYIGDAQKLARLGVSTHETKVSIADARKIAGAIKQTYGSDLDGEEIAKAIQEAYAPIVTGSDDTDAWEKSEGILTDIAERIAKSSKDVMPADTRYDDLKSATKQVA